MVLGASYVQIYSVVLVWGEALYLHKSSLKNTVEKPKLETGSRIP